MYTKYEEQQFFLKHLNPEQRVLEYGSGESSIEISKLVKELVTVEHLKEWSDQLNNKQISNITVLYCPPDLPYQDGIQGMDGTFDEFKTYINAPKKYKKFDVIFIDGRARVECAKFAHEVANKNCLIFVHDFFSRQESENYKDILNYLEIVDGVGDMCKLKLK